MGYIAEYSKPLLEHEHNANEHHHIDASCKQNGAPEVEEFSSVLDSGSRDGADVRVDILECGTTEPESVLGLANSDGDGDTTSKQECCSRWGFKDMPPLPALSPVDPFLNDSYYFSGLWEWVKLIMCAPLILALLLLVGFCCTKLALWGWERNHKPMPLWRREIMWGTRVCARGILFCFGFHWIQREHTFGDLMLAVKASKLKLCPSISFMLEMGKQLQLTTSDAIHYLEKFATINSSLSGLLTRGEFLEHLGLTDGPVCEQMFALFDRHGHGFINFQELVAASVCLSRHEEFARLVRSTFQSFDRDNNEVLILEEVETMLRSTFSEATTKRLAGLLASEQAVHIEFDDFQRHLSRNPELVFPLALAAEGL